MTDNITSQVTKITIPSPFEDPDREFLLIKFSGNYADEINVNGFSVMTKEDWADYQQRIPNRAFNYYFGSNEDIEFTDKSDSLKHYKITEITFDAVQVFLQIFGKPHTEVLEWDGEKHCKQIDSTIIRYGIFPTFEDEDEDEDEDDEE